MVEVAIDGGGVVAVPQRQGAPQLADGDAAKIAVRPETIGIERDGGVRADAVNAAVLAVTYFGAYSEILAKVGTTQVTVRTDPHEAAGVTAGDTVELLLRPDALALLSSEAATPEDKQMEERNNE